MAWNNLVDNDCTFAYYKQVDWDTDGNPDQFQNHPTTCDGDPFLLDEPPLSDTVNSDDYIGDVCSGSLVNRATEYDYLRFFWNLSTEQNVPFEDVLDILDDADPWTWNRKDSGAAQDFPPIRLGNQAVLKGYGAEWTSLDVQHGVHR